MSLIIDRAFVAVLLLSMSGFVCSAIFLLIEKYAYRFTSAKTMVLVNTAVLFSFVIPFYFVASIMDRSEYYFAKNGVLVFADASKYEGFVGIVRGFGWIEYLGSIWLLGVIVFLIFYLSKYIHFTSCVRRDTFFIDDDAWALRFSELKNEKNMPDVKLIGCSSISTPCTFGVKSKYIAIPSYMINSFDAEEIEFILRHELYHVAHRDLPRKILVTILNCLNWFNPLYYLLRNNLSDWMEVACDEEVTKGLNKAQRMKYCQLIIKILELEQNAPSGKEICVGFIGIDMKNYKRRMMNIMRKNGGNSIWGKAAAASIVVVSMVSGNVVAKAADAPVNQMFSKNAEVVTTEEVEVIEGEYVAFEDDFAYIEHESTGEFEEIQWNPTEAVDFEIVYQDGTTESLTADAVQAEAKHAHMLKDITIKEHKKNSDGSCKTTYYDGQKCTSCGTTWKGDVIRTVTDAKCTH